MSVIDIITNYNFAEFVFTLIVIATCFLIFLKTRKFYELSVKHSGIKYFRYVFLFFGLTYTVRLILNFSFLFPFKIFGLITNNLIYSVGVYTGALTFFYIMLMFFWEKIGDTLFANSIIIHMASFSFAIISVLSEHPYLFAVFQFAIIIAIAIMAIEVKTKEAGKESSLPTMFMLYSLVFGHWILIAVLEVFVDFYPILGFFIYAITVLFLVTFIWRVLLHLGWKNERKRKT